MHPSIASIMQYFAFEHLPPHLQAVSKLFAMLAAELAKMSPTPELTVALRKLLESKDATVRAALPQLTPTDVAEMMAGWAEPSSARERVVLELAALEDKTSRLAPFLASEKFASLPDDARQLLERQDATMREYAEILRARLTAWVD